MKVHGKDVVFLLRARDNACGDLECRTPFDRCSLFQPATIIPDDILVTNPRQGIDFAIYLLLVIIRAKLDLL